MLRTMCTGERGGAAINDRKAKYNSDENPDYSQAGAELCRAQDKLVWVARLLSLTFKLFLPLKLFTNKMKIY
jgi:hypothetical protein